MSILDGLTLKEEFDVGDTVICDWCGEDYTDSNEKGGVCFGSKACCPKCEPRVRELAKKHNEEQYLGESCPPDMTFKAWVLQLRGGDNKIKIYSSA